MNVKRYIHLIGAALIASSVVLTGCFDEIGGAFDDTPQLEFEQVSGSYSVQLLDGAGTLGLQVNLIGPQQDQDIQASVVVNEEETSAQEGVHYSFPNGTDFTIPAGESFGQVAVQVLNAELPPGSARALTIELQDVASGEIIAAENLKTFSIVSVARSADVQVSPNIAIGNVASSETETSFAVIENTGTRATEVQDVTLEGAEFTFDGFFVPSSGEEGLEAGDELAPPFSLAPGEAALVQVTYNPSAVGIYDGTVSFDVTNESPEPTTKSIALSARSIGEISFSEATLDFEAVVGETEEVVINVVNSGTEPVDLSAPSFFEGATPGSEVFDLESPTFPLTVAPTGEEEEGEEIVISFSPTASGTATGTFELDVDDGFNPVSTVTFELSGVATEE